MKRVIKCSSEVCKSIVSVDFTWEDDYDEGEVTYAIESALQYAGVTPLGSDIHSVDYSMYHDYDNVNVSQISCDFAWEEDYPADVIEEYIIENLAQAGVGFAGISFESLL